MEVHESGRMRTKQKRGGEINAAATQRDADGSRHALLRKVQISRARKKAHAASDALKCGS